MFTGIVTDIGTIDAVEQRGDLRVAHRAAATTPPAIDLGASIACSGVCLTVVDKGAGLVRGRCLGRNRVAHRAGHVGPRAARSTSNAR